VHILLFLQKDQLETTTYSLCFIYYYLSTRQRLAESPSTIFCFIRLAALIFMSAVCLRVTAIIFTVINKKTNQECKVPHLLFYRNVCLSLLYTYVCIRAVHSRFIGCLPLEISIINLLIVNN
jgi:hypothetical protein